MRRGRFSPESIARSGQRRRAARTLTLLVGFIALVLTGLSAGFSGFGGRAGNDLGAVLFILAGLVWVLWIVLVAFLLLRALWRWLQQIIWRFRLRRF